MALQYFLTGLLYKTWNINDVFKRPASYPFNAYKFRNLRAFELFLILDEIIY